MPKTLTRLCLDGVFTYYVSKLGATDSGPHRLLALLPSDAGLGKTPSLPKLNPISVPLERVRLIVFYKSSRSLTFKKSLRLIMKVREADVYRLPNGLYSKGYGDMTR